MRTPSAGAPGLTDRWRDQAACRSTDPELFFPVGSTAPALEYVTNALYNLDGHLSAQITHGRRPAAPVEAEVFHGVLVEALLHALADESPCRAAFSEQLAQTWPALHRPT